MSIQSALSNVSYRINTPQPNSPLSVRLSAPNPSQMQTRIKCNAKRYKPTSQHIKRISVTTETPEYDTQDQKKTSTSRRKKSSVTTREASKTAKESIPTKEKNNINARNVIHIQQTTQTKHNAACLQHGGGETTDNTLMTNGRRVRK